MKSKKAEHAKIDTIKVNESQLDRAFKRALKAVQAVSATAPSLEQELMRYVKLQKEIKAEFGGKLFLADGPPTSVENIRRFRTYIRMRGSATTIIVNLIHELMRVHGICPDHPHLMCEQLRFDGGSEQPKHLQGPPQQRLGVQPTEERSRRNAVKNGHAN